MDGVSTLVESIDPQQVEVNVVMLTLAHTSSGELEARLGVRERELFPNLPQLHAAPLEIARVGGAASGAHRPAFRCTGRSGRVLAVQQRDVNLAHVHPELPARELGCQSVDEIRRQNDVHQANHVLRRHRHLLVLRLALRFLVEVVAIAGLGRARARRVGAATVSTARRGRRALAAAVVAVAPRPRGVRAVQRLGLWDGTTLVVPRAVLHVGAAARQGAAADAGRSSCIHPSLQLLLRWRELGLRGRLVGVGVGGVNHVFEPLVAVVAVQRLHHHVLLDVLESAQLQVRALLAELLRGPGLVARAVAGVASLA
jgi:hypothetical protein